MSELQNALDSLVNINNEWDPIVKAARLVANPDYQAVFRHGKEVLAGLGVTFTKEDEQNVRDLVNAALHIDPPEEE